MSKLRIGACCQEDYRRTVTEIDEKEYISLKIIVSELRNQYVSLGVVVDHLLNWTQAFSMLIFCSFFSSVKVTLHDMILKNIEKIKRPRSSNADALYWCSAFSDSAPLPAAGVSSSPALICRTTSRAPPSSKQSSSASYRQCHSFHSWTQFCFFYCKIFSCFKPFENASILSENRETSHRRQEAQCIFSF